MQAQRHRMATAGRRNATAQDGRAQSCKAYWRREFSDSNSWIRLATDAGGVGWGWRSAAMNMLGPSVLDYEFERSGLSRSWVPHNREEAQTPDAPDADGRQGRGGVSGVIG